MDNNFIEYLREVSLDSILISAIICFITAFLKVPIKNFSSNLNKEKEKIFNNFITFIPFVLSIVYSTIRFIITDHKFLVLNILEKSIESWILSLTLYAIYEKTKIFISGLCLLKSKNSISEEAKLEITELKESLNNDQNQLKKIEKQIESLNKCKELLINVNNEEHKKEIHNANIKIKILSAEKNTIKNEISRIAQKIENIKNENKEEI